MNFNKINQSDRITLGKIKSKSLKKIVNTFFGLRNKYLLIPLNRINILKRSIQGKGKVPDFIIIGVKKGGTTSIFKNLELHPEVEFCPHFCKLGPTKKIMLNEPYFFTSKYCPSLKRIYFSIFNNNEKLQGEKSPHYIREETTIKSIKKICPNTKIIITLRDPVTRAYSDYNHNRMDKGEKKVPSRITFNDNEIELGKYDAQIKNVLKHFPKEQVHIIITEKMKADMKKTYGELYKFLGIKNIQIPLKKGVHKRDYIRAISKQEEKELYQIYEPHNKNLFKLLGYEIPEWNH